MNFGGVRAPAVRTAKIEVALRAFTEWRPSQRDMARTTAASVIRRYLMPDAISGDIAASCGPQVPQSC